MLRKSWRQCLPDNFPVNKSVINYIHARDFFLPGEAENCYLTVKDLRFVPKKYGTEIDQFHMIFPHIDVLWGKMLGDILDIVEHESGLFRLPYEGVIHFEDYHSVNEWCFAVALDHTEFQTHVHTSGIKNMLSMDPQSPTLDFFNPDEWTRETSILMKPNDALFYRPWIFHSFGAGMIHTYRIQVQ